MIYELRTYTLAPGIQPEYLRLGEIGRRVRGDRYGTLQGAWTSEFGTLNRYVHLWSYADAGERERVRAALAKDEGWTKEYLPRTQGMIVAQENKILLPVEGVPLKGPSSGSHVYELRTYRTQPRKAMEWANNFKRILPVREQYGEVAGLWVTDVGQLNQVLHLYAWKSLDERLETRARLFSDPRWLEFVPTSTPMLMEMESIILIPVSTSPLH